MGFWNVTPMPCQDNSMQILHISSIQPIHGTWESLPPSPFLPSTMSVFIGILQGFGSNVPIDHFFPSWMPCIALLLFALIPIKLALTVILLGTHLGRWFLSSTFVLFYDIAGWYVD
jgi:general stress protein CsbA